jgi:predicted ester cyclase
VTLDANKALIRRVFEKVIPAGDSAAMRDLVAPDWIDHDPLPGQPAGLEGAEYVVSTMHGAHPDLRFSIDDLIAENDRVAIRWTLRASRSSLRP